MSSVICDNCQNCKHLGCNDHEDVIGPVSKAGDPPTDQPSTAAGQALLGALRHAQSDRGWPMDEAEAEQRILAVEAEARADTARPFSGPLDIPEAEGVILSPADREWAEKVLSGEIKVPRADTARLVPTITPDYDVVWEPNEADTARPVCNCPESGTSGSCPFHDAHTVGAEITGKPAQIVALREALEAVYSNAPNWFEMVEAVLNDTAQAAAKAVAEIEVKAVERALVRMKALGILIDKVRQPKVTARALLASVSQEGEGA